MAEQIQNEDVEYLNFPHVERQVFNKNFLDQVVIELRFPTLLRLKEREPLEIQEAIFSEFPNYQYGQKVELTPLGSTHSEPSYEFLSRKKDYRVELTASHLVLETRSYESFEIFLQKMEFLIEACLPHINTNFFTRIGLRYINKIGNTPNDRKEAIEWVHPSLMGPVANDQIGAVSSMKGEISGAIESGAEYRFKFGLSPPVPGHERAFFLDYDYSREDVEAVDALHYLQEFHEVHFPFFWWSLGNKAREALIDGSAKKGG